MPTTFERERQLQSEIAPRVEHRLPGVDVLAVELLSPAHFCVYVDHPGGVDHALCSRVTDLLRDYLREYTVDVSSPGTERPLRKPAHFRSAVGRRVKLRTADKRVKGVVASAEANHLSLDVADGERQQIPYDHIVRANLIEG